MFNACTYFSSSISFVFQNVVFNLLMPSEGKGSDVSAIFIHRKEYLKNRLSSEVPL